MVGPGKEARKEGLYRNHTDKDIFVGQRQNSSTLGSKSQAAWSVGSPSPRCFKSVVASHAVSEKQGPVSMIAGPVGFEPTTFASLTLYSFPRQRIEGTTPYGLPRYPCFAHYDLRYGPNGLPSSNST